MVIDLRRYFHVGSGAKVEDCPSEVWGPSWGVHFEQLVWAFYLQKFRKPPTLVNFEFYLFFLLVEDKVSILNFFL